MKRKAYYATLYRGHGCIEWKPRGKLSEVHTETQSATTGSMTAAELVKRAGGAPCFDLTDSDAIMVCSRMYNRPPEERAEMLRNEPEVIEISKATLALRAKMEQVARNQEEYRARSRENYAQPGDK